MSNIEPLKVELLNDIINRGECNPDYKIKAKKGEIREVTEIAMDHNKNGIGYWLRINKSTGFFVKFNEAKPINFTFNPYEKLISNDTGKLIDSKIEYYQATLGLAEGLCRFEDCRRLSETIEHLEEIKQSITFLPSPTSEELCEELGEHLNTEVVYSDNTFFNQRTNSIIVTIGKITGGVSINRKLSPSLGKRVFEFYEMQRS